MRCLGILLLFAVLPAGAASEQWLRLKTPHFEMYTTASEKRAREAILYFEEIHSFFGKVAVTRSAPSEVPARIVAFRSRKQFEPYAPNSVAAAFYVPGRSRDYIVMSDAEPEHLPTAFHEYTHLTIHHTGLKLPLWLNEGLAEVYSTLKPLGPKAVVGNLLPGRVAELRQEKWLPLDTLTSVEHDSAIYNEKTRVGIFYAESWALTHMLYLSPGYREHFPAFVSALQTGATAAEAFQSAFHRPGSQVFKDLQSYLNRNQLFGAVFEVSLSKSEEEAEISEASEFESALVSADLLSTTGKLDRAQTEYDTLEARYPGKPEIPQSQGYLAWQSGQLTEARKYFETAFDRGNKDPQMCYDLGLLERSANNTKDRAIPAFLRALSVRPEYTDARLELGYAELEVHDEKAALGAFARIQNIDGERAPRLFIGLSYAYAEAGNLGAARKNADEAKKWNRREEDKAQIRRLLSYLDAVASWQESTARGVAPPASHLPHRDLDGDSLLVARIVPGEPRVRVEGEAKALNCVGAGATFTIATAGGLLTFDMPRPDQIVLKHLGDATADFICGPQKPFHVAVEYVPAKTPGGTVAGELKQLEF